MTEAVKKSTFLGVLRVEAVVLVAIHIRLGVVIAAILDARLVFVVYIFPLESWCLRNESIADDRNQIFLSIFLKKFFYLRLDKGFSGSLLDTSWFVRRQIERVNSQNGIKFSELTKKLTLACS